MMAENVLPGANGTNADATRGIAYYEKLKRDLGDTLPRKRAMDKNMVIACDPSIDLLQELTPSRHNSKNRYSGSRANTWKKRRQGTSSKASTTTSRAPSAPEELPAEAAEARPRGGRAGSWSKTECSVGAPPAS